MEGKVKRRGKANGNGTNSLILFSIKLGHNLMRKVEHKNGYKFKRCNNSSRAFNAS